MNDPLIVSIMAGMAVITLIIGVGLAFSQSIGSPAEQRLEDLTNKPKKDLDLSGGILLRPPAVDLEQPPFWTKLIPNLENLTRLYEQADVNMPFNRFMGIVVALSLLGAVVGYFLGLPPYLVPLGSAVLGIVPFLWLIHRKKRR